jgi:DNA-binding NtrC family response regulator
MSEITLSPTTRRILVVEDDVDVSRTIAEMLDRLGHIPAVCNHAEEAFSLAQSKSFDLLLIDYRMPEMTGLDLIVMLRQECSNVPIIMMTGYPATEERVSSKRLGVSAILRKPVTAEQLDSTINEAFDTSATEREMNDQAKPESNLWTGK